MLLLEALFVLISILHVSASYANPIAPPIKCHGPVPKISKGRYYLHDNDTYQLQISTRIQIQLNLHETSCFQVEIPQSDNASTNKGQNLTSLFYSIRYASYQQVYDVRKSYEFGIAEIQSYCKCDCPSGETFCVPDFGRKRCSKGEVCVTRFHDLETSKGCQNTDTTSNLCCEISVKPYENRRFTALNFASPRPKTSVRIEIFAKFNEKWTIFRKYKRVILPYTTNLLRLNGFENVAEMYIHASSEGALINLKNGDKYYFFEQKTPFELLDDTRINSDLDRNPNKFGWLRFEENEWNVGDPLLTLYDLQRPLVTNCKKQQFVDRYFISSSNVVVVRNSSGAISGRPFLGANVKEKQRFIDEVQLIKGTYGDYVDKSIIVTFKPVAAPSLKLDIKLNQKMQIIAHTYASYLETFVATIRLDRHANRFLNITLVKAHGKFVVEIFRRNSPAGIDEYDLSLSLATKLPVSANSTQILPLPGTISSSRLICVRAAEKSINDNKLCKWAEFKREPLKWFQLQETFLETQGTCPGCNKDTIGDSFLRHLNPRSWFDGINSVTEGVALGVEIVAYVLVLVFLVAFWRKCLYPLIRWAMCSKRAKNYMLVKPKACRAGTSE